MFVGKHDFTTFSKNNAEDKKLHLQYRILLIGKRIDGNSQGYAHQGGQDPFTGELGGGALKSGG